LKRFTISRHYTLSKIKCIISSLDSLTFTNQI